MENRNNKHGFFYCISPVLVFLGLSILSGVVLGVISFMKFGSFGGSVSSTEILNFVSSCTHMTYFAVYGVLTVYCTAKFFKKEKRCFDDKYIGGSFLKNTFFALLYGLSLNIATEVLIVMLGGIFDISSLLNAHSQSVDSLMTDSPLFNLLLLGAAAPIAEELMMRSLVFNRLRSDLSEGYAIGISALIFALLHYPSVLQIGYAFVLGVVLAYAYVKYEKIYVPIMIHAGFNLTSFILMIPAVENFFGTVAGMLMHYFLAVALCAFSYKALRNKEKPQLKPQGSNEAGEG